MKDNIFWLLLIFASVYILGNIGTGSLSTFDEAIYANISRNIVKTGDWLVMRQGEKLWFDKPPLYMWCTAVFYKIFGVSEFSTRLTSGILGVASVLLLYLFGKKLADKMTGLLSALILLAFPHYIHFSKMGMMDVPVAFFTLLTLYLFWLGAQKEKYLFYSGAILCVSYLLKGFAAFLPLLVIIVYAVLSKDIRLVLRRQFLLGTAVAFSVIFIWHLAQFLLTGPAALKGYFGFHIFQRATSVLEGHKGGLDYYIRVIFKKNMPWSIMIFASVFYAAYGCFKDRDKRLVFLLSWVLVTLFLYSAVRTKLQWYIMPIYPALALLSAFLLKRFLTKKLLYVALIVILAGMLAQIPLSWAFKLEYTPDIKKVSALGMELHKAGNDIYMISGNDSEIFYYDFTRELDKSVYQSLISQGKKEIYCIILPDIFKEKKEEYNFDYEPIYESERTLFYKITFKDRK
ncbi:MAG: glycosyltransferase family 39 protein [Candidatus Omnitrophota bacterium]|nr:glycosyltransferase family 39 protein [Candidatus Omnitrophota bacterium]